MRLWCKRRRCDMTSYRQDILVRLFFTSANRSSSLFLVDKDDDRKHTLLVLGYPWVPVRKVSKGTNACSVPSPKKNSGLTDSRNACIDSLDWDPAYCRPSVQRTSSSYIGSRLCRGQPDVHDRHAAIKDADKFAGAIIYLVDQFHQFRRS